MVTGIIIACLGFVVAVLGFALLTPRDQSFWREFLSLAKGGIALILVLAGVITLLAGILYVVLPYSQVRPEPTQVEAQ